MTQILAVRIDNLDKKEAISQINNYINNMLPRLIVTPNPEIIVSATKNTKLRQILNQADLALPDGVGIIIAGKILKNPFKERVPGIDLMESLLQLADQQSFGIYLLGASPAVVQTAAQKIQQNYPGLRVVGTMHGYFKTADEEQEVIADIHEAKPDLLFVGMGSPRQELWAAKHLKNMPSTVAVCVGGSFDVISGYLKRAPKLFRRLGLEWLFRLFQEPKRWRRMLVLPWFLWLVIRERQRTIYKN